MYTLVIKGIKFEAGEAARNRGVTIFDLEEHDTNTTLAKANDNQGEKLAAWFAEPIEAIKGFGFPRGSLLLFSKHPDAREG